MSTMKPTIGRRVWYWPNGVTATDTTPFSIIDKAQALDAGVVYVWNDRMVNLDVTDHYGTHHRATSVPLLQPGEAPPTSGGYCTWMPYQIGQAAQRVDVGQFGQQAQEAQR